MKILISYLRHYRGLIAVALVLATINISFSLVDPIIFGRIVSIYVQHFDRYTFQTFLAGVGGWLLLSMGTAFVSRVAKNFQDYYINVITQRLGARVYNDGIEHSLALPYSVFEDQRSGQTLGTVQKVRADIEKLVSSSINLVFTSVIGIVFVTIYALYLHWLIALIYLIMPPIIGVLSMVLSKKIKTIQKTIVAQTTALAGSTTESLRNIELVKSLGLTNQEIGRLNSTTDKILALELKKVTYTRKLSFLQGTTVNFLRISLLLVMLLLIFNHVIDAGQFFTLWVFSFFIFTPLQEIGNFIAVYREAEASLQNFSNIMSTPPEEKPEKPEMVGLLKEFEFKDVSFQHQSAIYPALQRVSFSVKRGETIAFVGPSGAGKTTLVKLLVGLYHPQTGSILYNHLNSKDIDLDELRNHIGYVTQDAQLFSGSIRENLLYVRPGASDAECMAALHQAACESLLARASNGLDTVIGEGGVKVSGGEKQRLSIARALLRNPQLLVFDEATSALDSITEEEISATIRDVSRSSDQITILIAHRLSTIMHADRIYVLERGEIVEFGEHHSLLAEKGLYYAMWRQQIGERDGRTMTRIALDALHNQGRN
ncbi:MAG TPA: ABC transporter ATP-binding protein [Candidatus Kapabacteria bacterium]|nr:ABC transporter ATP-binding protein [Candidatus Kapabacteria bacterium]